MKKSKYKFNFKKMFFTLFFPIVLLIFVMYVFTFSKSSFSTVMGSTNSNINFAENTINYDIIKIDNNSDYLGARSKSC